MRCYGRDQSITLLFEVIGEAFDTFVEFSGVLGHTVFHLAQDVEGSNDEVVFGAGHACASVFLGHIVNTFLR